MGLFTHLWDVALVITMLIRWLKASKSSGLMLTLMLLLPGVCQYLGGDGKGEWRQQSFLPPSRSLKRKGYILEFMFQHDCVVHTEFTFLPLELPFVWISNANRIQYSSGAGSQDGYNVGLSAYLFCGTVYTETDVDPEVLVRSSGVSLDQWYFWLKDG